MAGTELPITARAYNLGLESNLPHSRTRFQPSRIRKEIGEIDYPPPAGKTCFL